ncbi:hypothetical protein COJ48_16710 [Bacillus cereus]|nr:hypothetical protein COJ48_16710 [Bacillus cereus]
MNDKDYMYEELSDFLDGTFHQDMGTAEKALNEFIEEAHKVCIENTIKDKYIIIFSLCVTYIKNILGLYLIKLTN